MAASSERGGHRWWVGRRSEMSRRRRRPDIGEVAVSLVLAPLVGLFVGEMLFDAGDVGLAVGVIVAVLILADGLHLLP
jgi:hypothetical protein